MIGAIALLAPLIRSEVVPESYPAAIFGVSGYSGGGKALIGEFESQPNGDAPPFYIYGLTLTHKHLEEIRFHSLLTGSPVFVPSVGRFRQGMLICIPLHIRELPEGVARPGILDILCDAYENDPFIKIRRNTGSQESERVDPSVFEGTNYMELAVYSDAENERLLLGACPRIRFWRRKRPGNNLLTASWTLLWSN